MATLGDLLQGVANGTLFHEISGAAEEAGNTLVTHANNTAKDASGALNSYLSPIEQSLQKTGVQLSDDGLNRELFNPTATVNAAKGFGQDVVSEAEGNPLTAKNDAITTKIPLELAGGAIRGIPDAIVQLGATANQAIGGTGEANFNGNPVDKAIFGGGPQLSIQERSANDKQVLNKYGITGPLSTGLGLVGATTATGANFLGAEGGEADAAEKGLDQVSQAIAEAKTPDDIPNLTRIAGKYQPEVEKVLPDLAAAKSPEEVKQILSQVPDDHLNVYHGGAVPEGTTPDGAHANGPAVFFTENPNFASQFKDDQGESGTLQQFSIPKNKIMDMSNPLIKDQVEKEIGPSRLNDILKDGYMGVPEASAENVDALKPVAQKLGYKGAAFAESPAYEGEPVKSIGMYDTNPVQKGFSEFSEPSLRDPAGLPNSPATRGATTYNALKDERQTLDNTLGREKVDDLQKQVAAEKYGNTPLKLDEQTLNSMKTALNKPDLTEEEAKEALSKAASWNDIKRAAVPAPKGPQMDVHDLIPHHEADDPATVQNYINQLKQGQSLNPLQTIANPDGTHTVLDGNHRLEALKQMGHTTAPVAPVSRMDLAIQSLSKGEQLDLANLTADMRRITGQAEKANDPEAQEAARSLLQNKSQQINNIVKKGMVLSTPNRDIAGTLFDKGTADELSAKGLAARRANGSYNLQKSIGNDIKIPDVPGDADVAPNKLLSSINNSPKFSDDLKNEINSSAESTHETLHNATVFDNARAAIKADPQEAFNRVMRGEHDVETNAISQLLLDQAHAAGDNDTAIKLAQKMISTQAIESGRSVQIWANIAKDLNPTSALILTQRQMEKNMTPVAREAVSKAGDDLAGQIAEVNKGVVDQVANETAAGYGQTKRAIKGDTTNALIDKVKADFDIKPPAEELASGNVTREEPKTTTEIEKLRGKAVNNLGQRISPHVEPNNPSPVRDMVNMLYSEARTVLPKKVQEIPDPLKLVSDAIKNSGEYQKVWDLTRASLYTKYANEPDKLDQLSEFFDHALDKPYSDTKLNSAVQQGLKGNEVNMAQLVRQHYSTVDQVGNDLKSDLVSKAGLTEEEAKTFSQDVQNRFAELTNAKKEQILTSFGKTRSTPIPKSYMDKVIELSNLGGLSKEQFYPIAAKRLNIPYLDEDLAGKIMDKADEIQKIPDDQVGIKNKASEELLQNINDATQTKGQKFSRAFSDYRYGNLLSSPTTQETKTASHIIQGGIVEPATKLVSGGIDYVKAGLTGAEREHYANEVPAYYKGMANSLPDAWEKMLNVISGKESYYQPDINHVASTSAFAKPAQVIKNIFNANDAFFGTLFEGGEKESLATKYTNQGKSIDSNVINSLAHDKAQTNLFRSALDPQNKTQQGKVLSSIDKVGSTIQHLTQQVPAMKWITPFVTLPTNILKKGIEYSPLGLSTLVGSGDKTEQLSKALIGSGVMGTAAAMAFKGDSTWAVPTNPTAKKEFYAKGYQPYSLKVGDKWVSYSKLGPLAYPVAMAAALHYQFEQNPSRFTTSTMGKLGESLVSMAGFFADQSYVENIGALANGIKSASSGASTALTSLLANLAGQTIPMDGLLAWVDRITDPVQRDATTVGQKIEEKLPVLSENVPRYPGEPARPYPLLNATQPFQMSQYKPYNESGSSSGSTSGVGAEGFGDGLNSTVTTPTNVTEEGFNPGRYIPKSSAGSKGTKRTRK